MHAQLLQAFDDCTTLAATFKLLESFEGLLERDTIAAELAKKHLTMVTAFADDIKEVHEVFQAHQEFPLLSKNSPPHSGTHRTACNDLNVCTCAEEVEDNYHLLVRQAAIIICQFHEPSGHGRLPFLYG